MSFVTMGEEFARRGRGYLDLVAGFSRGFSGFSEFFSVFSRGFSGSKTDGRGECPLFGSRF